MHVEEKKLHKLCPFTINIVFRVEDLLFTGIEDEYHFFFHYGNIHPGGTGS